MLRQEYYLFVIQGAEGTQKRKGREKWVSNSQNREFDVNTIDTGDDYLWSGTDAGSQRALCAQHQWPTIALNKDIFSLEAQVDSVTRVIPPSLGRAETAHGHAYHPHDRTRSCSGVGALTVWGPVPVEGLARYTYSRGAGSVVLRRYKSITNYKAGPFECPELWRVRTAANRTWRIMKNQ